MMRVRVFQVITRMVRGGAQRVVQDLLDRLPRPEFEQTLVCGAESAPPEAVRIPEMVREIRPTSDAAAVARLAELFLARRPQVVHAHTYKAGVLATVAARLAGVPAIIFTPHGHIFGKDARIPGVPEDAAKLGALRWITRAAQACAHRVTALSETDLADQLALGLSPASKYVVVRNGIDFDRFDRPSAPRRDGEFVLGAVGRFTTEKGHRYLLEAFARVRRGLPSARLVLVGYGELDAELRRQAEVLSVADGVTFTGERDSAEMLPAFDLFVQPSLYESQGIAILEAMAAGRPVVATDVGGVRDVVRDGETGLLVPSADPDALAAAILRLARAPELAARLAARGRENVRTEYSVDRMVSSYERLYMQVLGRYNPRPCLNT
jgi:glycosyltransferase involved in cell wall biosynthesis